MAHHLQTFGDPYDARRAWSTVQFTFKENFMGKYVLAWLLGVPVFVLVIVYLFMH